MSQSSGSSMNPIRSVLGRRSRAPEALSSTTSSAGGDTHPHKKRLDTGWGVLRESLKIVERSSDMCLPLKAAVGGLLGVMEYVEVSDRHRCIS